MPRKGIILPPPNKIWRPLTKDEIEKIIEASLKVLKEVGTYIENTTILQVAKDKGCSVDFEKKIVYYPEHVVNEFIKKVPKYNFLLAGRTEKDDIVFSEKTKKAYGGFASPMPQVYFTDDEKENVHYRDATSNDLVMVMRLYDALPNIDFIMMPILDMQTAQKGLPSAVHEVSIALSNTTKHINLGNAAPKNPEEWRYYARLAAEVVGGLEELKKRPIISGMSLFTPPLRLAKVACFNLLGPIQYGLPILLGGANAPLTILNGCNMVVHHASVLAIVSLSQMLSPGIPCMLNSWNSSLHLLHVTMAFPAPENILLNAAQIQLIHDHLGIPINHSPTVCAKTTDIQAAYEATMAHYMLWITGCDVWTNYSFNDYAFNSEMLLFHNELAGYFNHMGKRFKDTIPTDETIAFNAIKDVGPTADYFTHEITLNNMDLQYTPELADYRTYANWSKDKKTMLTNIRNKLKQLEKHQPPPLPKDTQQNMMRIVKEADDKLPA